MSVGEELADGGFEARGELLGGGGGVGWDGGADADGEAAGAEPAFAGASLVQAEEGYGEDGDLGLLGEQADAGAEGVEAGRRGCGCLRGR